VIDFTHINSAQTRLSAHFSAPTRAFSRENTTLRSFFLRKLDFPQTFFRVYSIFRTKRHEKPFLCKELGQLSIFGKLNWQINPCDTSYEVTLIWPFGTRRNFPADCFMTLPTDRGAGPQAGKQGPKTICLMLICKFLGVRKKRIAQWSTYRDLWRVVSLNPFRVCGCGNQRAVF
jgi:hypothetical protein